VIGGAKGSSCGLCFSQGLLADKTVLGVGEVTDANAFKQLLYSVHTELGALLQTEGTQAITHKVATVLVLIKLKKFAVALRFL